MPGARIGTIMKIVIDADMICAMRGPETRSRTSACATTRVAAALKPCTQRAARKSPKVGAIKQSSTPKK